MKKYFCYDQEEGFTLHATIDDAKTQANEIIAAYRESAHEGWLDEVSFVCCGTLNQRATEIKGEQFNEYGDYYANYELRDV